MWQAGLVVVLVYFVLLVRRLVVESGLGGLSVEGGASFVGLVVVFLGSCLALFGCWQYCGGLCCLLVAFGVCVFCFGAVW